MKTSALGPVHEWNEDPNRFTRQNDAHWQSVVPDPEERPLILPAEDAPIGEPVPDQPQQP